MIFGRLFTHAAPAAFGALALTGSLAATAGASSLTPAVRPPHVTLTVSISTVEVNAPLKEIATVVPRTPGLEVFLQRRRGGHWQNIGSGTTNAKGSVTFHRDFGEPASIKLRAHVVATAVFPELVSAASLEQVIPVPPLYAGTPALAPTMSGPRVTALQQRLTQLGYWVGTDGGYFGDATQQAIYALQKAAGLNPSGVVTPSTVDALVAGTLPKPLSTTGYVVEVDLKDDVLMVVNNGAVQHVLNVSSGGGYTYTEDGETDVAITPRGYFHVNRAVNGLVTDTLGQLWRPRFFDAGYAIHGDSYVPPFAASHGCVRVSNEAIDWIWATNILPLGTPVWVYSK